ncbi:MAG: hypothetical protein ACR2PT_09435 [Endozoicomonas sp.]
MEVTLNKLLPVLLSILLAGSLKAAPMTGNTGDQDREKRRQEAREQHDRLTLEELDRLARLVDVMPGEVTGASRKTDKPKAESRTSAKRKAAPLPQGLFGSQFRDQVREIDRHGRNGKAASGAAREADPTSGENDDDMVEYVLEMPADNSASKQPNRMKVKVRRGRMKLHQQVQELNKILIDDVVRMGSLKAP